MALGNHDMDYGRAAFDRCRAQLRYPILSANTDRMQKTAVVRAHGVRVGVFAVAGSDFASLVKTEGFKFGDSVAAARDAVRDLREREHVDAVVMIGARAFRRRLRPGARRGHAQRDARQRASRARR